MSICVAHLVRKGNSPELLDLFVRTYLARPAGQAHDLVIILKGYDGTVPTELNAILQEVSHECVHVPDKGFDVSTYASVAAQLDYDYFCFLNSHCEILCDNWLSLMYDKAKSPSVGLVGASGSWQSFLENYKGRTRFDAVVPGVPIWRQLLRKLLHDQWLIKKIRRIIRARVAEPFPNVHIRTNVFMISRDLMLTVTMPKMRRKMDAYLFESGKNSLTRQVQAQGLDVLIVSADGKAYRPDIWYQANTFWRENQEGLLVADNKTRMYERGDMQLRENLSYQAWGPHADPGYPVSV